MDGTEATTRRGFVGWLAAGLAAVPFIGGIFVAGRAAGTPARAERPRRLPLCKMSEVPPTGLIARPVTYRMRRGPRVETVVTTVFVTRDPETGAIIALSNRCTHLGCPVVYEPDAKDAPLHCPCHDAKFSATGAVLAQPATRPLDRLTIAVPESDDGVIELVLS